MDDDATLLRRYAHTRDEAAFAALVHRHVDFVHSVAGRCVQGDADLARDVSQQVFLALARRAAALVGHPCLLGWLHTCACQRAADLVRSEARRRLRETTATTDPALAAEPPVPWENLAPVLDLALRTLGARDRETVLLRYFAQKPFADIAAALGTTEAAAQMRATRALEKLRHALQKRGVTSTASALGLALGANAVTAAPASVVTSTLACLASASAAGAGAAAAPLLFMSLVKYSAAALAAAALVGFVVLKIPTPSDPHADSAPPPAATALTSYSSRPIADDPATRRLAEENAALRALLADAEKQLKTRADENAVAREKIAELRRPLELDLISSTLRATLTPDEAVVTGGSLLPDGSRLYFFTQARRQTEGAREVIAFDCHMLALPAEAARSVGLSTLDNVAASTLQHGEVWSAEETMTVLSNLAARKDSRFLMAPQLLLTPGKEEVITIDDALTSRLRITPTINTSGKGVDIELHLETNPPREPAS